MDQYDKELEEKVPEFEGHAEPASHGALDISATVTAVQIHGLEAGAGHPGGGGGGHRRAGSWPFA